MYIFSVFFCILTIFLIKNSDQTCQSTVGVTTCVNERLINGKPLKINDYKAYLEFKQGEITEVPVGAFKLLNKVTKLQLSNHEITKLYPGSFDGLQDLQEITMYNNKLTRIDRDVFYFFVLTKINLGMNKIGFIDKEAFKYTPNIEDLNLGFNDIREVPNLEMLSKLQILRMDNNKIKTIGTNSFKSLRNLEKLDLSDNLLESIEDRSFSGLKNLKDLNLKSNYINKIDLSSLDILRSLKVIKLNINSLKCQDLQVIVRYLQNKRVQVVEGFSKKINSYKGMNCMI